MICIPNRTGFFVALLALLALGSAPSSAVTLHRGTNTEPRTLDPHLAVGNSAAVMLYDMFMGLTTLDAGGKMIPGAAERWVLSDDGLTYTFYLREGLVWSDGTPFTAEDFVYSYRRLVDPATAARFGSVLYPVKNAQAINGGDMPVEALGVTAPDDNTVTFTLEEPTAYFPQLLASNALAPVPRHVIEAEGTGWTRPGVMVSNGAYKLAERVPQTSVTAIKNDLFYDADNVTIDEVVYYPTESQGTTLSRFRAGELDIILNFPADQIDWVKENLPGTLRITPALGLYYLVPNHNRPPFNDARVRRALSLAIDRQAIVEQLLPPGVLPATMMVPPVTDGYSGQDAEYAAIPIGERMAEARRLLQEAGYSRDNPLVFSFKSDPIEQNRRISVALAAMWRGIGVNASLDNAGAQTVNRDARTGNFDVIRWTWFAPYDDAATFLGLLSSTSTANISGYSNPAFDAKLAEANAIRDPVARAALMQDAERLVMADNPVIPVYFHAGRRLVSPVVKGWIDNPRSANPTRYLRVER